MSSGLEDALFRLKFTAKQLKRQSTKTSREIDIEKKKVKKAIVDGHEDIARIHAQTVIRKQNERLNLLRLASRVESVASRVQTAVTMRQLTGNMGIVVSGLDRALQSMNMDQIATLMDKFEQQFEELDTSASYYEKTTGVVGGIDTPQEDVDILLQQTAEEAGIEMQQEIRMVEAPQTKPSEEVEDKLEERLRLLRN